MNQTGATLLSLFSILLAACGSGDSESSGQTSAGAGGQGSAGSAGAATTTACTIQGLCTELGAPDAATITANEEQCKKASGSASATCPAENRIGVCVLSTQKKVFYAPFTVDSAKSACDLSMGTFTPG